jgi:glycosyltransferase involved in cell wall biosynthesis
VAEAERVGREVEITVVIPTRNRWDRLERTLHGALGQDGVEVEVIVVDDGSTDVTGAMLRAHEDPRVHVITHAQSLGVAATRNHGIREARTEWIALLDDDDLWAPSKLSVQLAAARETNADFVYCAAAHVDADLRVILIEAAPDPDSLAALMLSYNAMPAGSSNVIVRRSLLVELGGFDVRFFHLADWDLWLRLSQGATGAACDEVLVGYVKHADNMVENRERDLFAELGDLAAKHREASRAYGREFDRAAVAKWVAATHRRAGRRTDAAAAYLRAVRLGDRRSLGSLLRMLVESEPHVEPWAPQCGSEPVWLQLWREPRAPAA